MRRSLLRFHSFSFNRSYPTHSPCQINSSLFCTQTTTATQIIEEENQTKTTQTDKPSSWYPEDEESDKAKNRAFKRRWLMYSSAAISAYLTYKIFKSPQQYVSLPNDISDEPLSFRSYLFSNVLANRALSRICAPLTEKTIPIKWRKYIYSSVGAIWTVDWNEFKQDLTQYTTFKQFFIRPLEYPRKLSQSDMISPSDGRVLTFGQIDEKNGTLEQIKGVTFKLKQFLYGYDGSNGANGPKINKENKLFYTIIYLCPGDYHRFHACGDEISIDCINHIVGDLYPVKPSWLEKIPGLFSLNERIVLSGKWKKDLFFAYVPVGAFNVGSINLNCDERIVTNQKEHDADVWYKDEGKNRNMKNDESLNYTPYEAKNKQTPFTKKYIQRFEAGQEVQLNKGDEIGYFAFGSTVVLVFEAPDFKFNVEPGQKIKYGDSLALKPFSLLTPIIMPRNAQWTAEEDAELTKLALNNSKQNNGILDWDQIVDLKSGQIIRRSKNAMISRWWKINKNEDDKHPSLSEPIRLSSPSASSDDQNNGSNNHRNMVKNETDSSLISCKNYYRHNIQTLQLTSFNLSEIQPFIQAFEEQILLNSEDANASVNGKNNDKNDKNNELNKKQIANLKKTVILQNKFLRELYTKNQHVQGVVREMVEVDEKLKFELKHLSKKRRQSNEDIGFLKKQLMQKDEQINILTKEIKKLRSIFECGLNENHKAFQNKYDSMHSEYIEHYKKTEEKTKNIQKIWTETNEKYQNLKNQKIEFEATLCKMLKLQNNERNHAQDQILNCMHSRNEFLGNLSEIIGVCGFEDLKNKMFDILRGTEYASKMDNVRKRKRNEIEIIDDVNMSQPKKKQKQSENNMNHHQMNMNGPPHHLQTHQPIKQLISLPLINAQYPQNNEIYRIPPPLPTNAATSNLSMRVPPPPPTALPQQGIQSVPDGIDLLLNAAEEMKK